ncbi:MAG: rhodanese-like domain-containing protein [Desulfosarcinaceae bacterium]|nr:rhodanese-like domain-containing protein [Desulfosarcinaceae bacterium]
MHRITDTITFARSAVVRSALLAVMLVSFGINPPATLAAEESVHLNPDAAMRQIAAQLGDPNFVLLDVRTPGEFAKGHIQGAKLLDFYHRAFLSRLKTLDRGKTYLLYCRTGNRSGRTLDTMAKLGFTEVAHLAGGIVAWQGKGYSLIKSTVVDPDLLAP